MRKITHLLFPILLALLSAGPAEALTIDSLVNGGSVSSPEDTAANGYRDQIYRASTTALGGGRKLIAHKTDDGVGITTTRIGSGRLTVSNEDNSGTGTVVWDGDTDPTTIKPGGLGSVDLTQDDGTAFQIGLRFFDYPNTPVTLALRLYDSRTPDDGSRFSEVRIIIDQAWNSTSTFPLNIPFNLFSAAGSTTIPAPGGATFSIQTIIGPGGAASVETVGAMTVALSGQATDTILEGIRTNGRCSSVPNAQGSVLDECGVCLEDTNANAGKDDCGVCFKGPPGYSYEDSKVFDGCGLCPGNANYEFPEGKYDACGACVGAPDYKDLRDACGLCPTSPNYQAPGGKKDACGVCIDGPDGYAYQDMRDACGLCPTAAGYVYPAGLKDRCGVCLNGPTGYTYELNKAFDACGLCPEDPGYQFPTGTRDACGVCTSGPNGYTYQDLRDACGVCPSDANYLAPAGKKDQCGVCVSGPAGYFYQDTRDICGVCGGTAKTLAECEAVKQDCTFVRPTRKIRTFEKRLIENASRLVRRFREDLARSTRNQCPISLTKADRNVRSAFRRITQQGEAIFRKGVKVCKGDCVTVSYANEVRGLSRYFKVLERESKRAASSVKKCYDLKNIVRQPDANNRGVNGVVQDVRAGVNKLIRDCQNTSVCNK